MAIKNKMANKHTKQIDFIIKTLKEIISDAESRGEWEGDITLIKETLSHAESIKVAVEYFTTNGIVKEVECGFTNEAPAKERYGRYGRYGWYGRNGLKVFNYEGWVSALEFAEVLGCPDLKDWEGKLTALEDAGTADGAIDAFEATAVEFIKSKGWKILEYGEEVFND